MKLINEKTKRQLTTVNKFFNSNEIHKYGNMFGTVVYPTGMGKTVLGCLIIYKYLREVNPNAMICIAYPDVGLDKNWESALHFTAKELGHNVVNFSQILFRTADRLVLNKEVIKCDLLIVDEIHDFKSNGRIEILNNELIKRTHMLGLTATPNDTVTRYCPIIDRVTEKEAIDNDWISNYLEFNLGIELSESERYEYEKITEAINNQLPKFGNNPLAVAERCLNGGEDQKGKYYPDMLWCEMVAKKLGWNAQLDLNEEKNREINVLYNPNMIKGCAKFLFAGIRDRTQLLYKSRTKVEISLEIIKRFDKMKTIVFSQSTEFADKLNDAINQYYSNHSIIPLQGKDIPTLGGYEVSVAYHSNLQTRMMVSDKTGKTIKFGLKRLKDRAIERIKNDESRVICTASSLDKGFDVEDMRLAIIASRTQNKDQRTQRGGRVKRKELSYKEKVIIVNIYYENTKDEDWLRESQKDAEFDVYWIKNVDEISYNPRKKPLIKISL